MLDEDKILLDSIPSLENLLFLCKLAAYQLTPIERFASLERKFRDGDRTLGDPCPLRHSLL